jgi:hypothetical protein
VIAALHDNQGVVGDGADEPMLLIDPSRPVPGQLATQRLWLSSP